MNEETKESDLRSALADLYVAGMSMPRHTPNPGGASTQHTYELSAANVWTFDVAMAKVAEVLGISDLPHNCCVGCRYFDEEQASIATERRRTLL